MEASNPPRPSASDRGGEQGVVLGGGKGDQGEGVSSTSNPLPTTNTTATEHEKQPPSSPSFSSPMAVPPCVRANRLGARSLMAAISLGDGDAIHKIIDSGIKLSVLDPPGALHMVADYYPEAQHLVPLLIDLGADKEKRDEVSGDTPLHRFVRANMLQAVADLLSRGVNLNCQNARQETALHMATRRREVVAMHDGGDGDDMVTLLLAYGADELIKDEKGKRAADYLPVQSPSK